MNDDWAGVRRLTDEWLQRDLVASFALEVGRTAGPLLELRGGKQRLDDTSASLRDDALFVVASITKPIVAMTVLTLVEEGTVGLSDKVARYVPGFGANGKQAITLRHLLTHTSGLPDMLPHNRPLRQRNAPLADFVAGTAALTPEYQPGHGVQYQSMGFAVLAEVVRTVAGEPLSRVLDERIASPLGMKDTSLGLPDDVYESGGADRIVELRVPTEQEDSADWGWNSRYWHQFGAPWGGLVTTPSDLGRFARAMLAGRGFCSPATVAAATTNRLVDFPHVPESDRRCRPWGLGWRLNWVTHSATFGDLLGPRTYGHFGATGTMLWIDPDLDAYAVVLTTTPFDPRVVPLARLSNVVAATLSRSNG